MDVLGDALAVLVIDAVVRFTTNMQGRVRRGAAAGRVGCGAALVREIRATGLLTVTGTGTGNLDVRAAAAFFGIVDAVRNRTL